MNSEQNNTAPNGGFTVVQLWALVTIFAILAILALIGMASEGDPDQEDATRMYGYNYGYYVEHGDTSWKTGDKYPEVYTNWKQTEDTPGSREYWGLDAVRRDGEGIRRVRHELGDLSLHAYDMSDTEHETIDFEPGQAYCVVSTHNDRERTATYFMAVGDYTKGLIDVPCEEYSVDEDLLQRID